MKIYAVYNGKVFQSTSDNKWTYQIIYRGVGGRITKPFTGYLSENSARQAMREKVKHERERHGLGE